MRRIPVRRYCEPWPRGSSREYGYAGDVLIDLIADRLGSTKGRVYHHFDSKPDLFFEIQIVAMKTLIGEYRSDRGGEGRFLRRSRPRMALKHAQMLFSDYAIQKVTVQGLERRLLGDAATKHVKTLRSIVLKRKQYEKLFAEIIADGIETGCFANIPVGLATKALFGTINWITIGHSPRKAAAKRTGRDRADLGGCCDQRPVHEIEQRRPWTERHNRDDLIHKNTD